MSDKMTFNDMKRKIIVGLHKEHLIKTWLRDKPEGWKLTNDNWSPFYLDIRQLPSASNELFKEAIIAMGILMKNTGYCADGKTKMIGIAMGGIPLAVGVSVAFKIPALYTKKLPDEVKTLEDVEKYIIGNMNKSMIIGEYAADDRLALVDDVVTGFNSKLKAIAQIDADALRKGYVPPLKLNDIFVLVDRGNNSVKNAGRYSLKVHSVINFLGDALPMLHEQNAISGVEYNVICDYISNNDRYQDVSVQKELKEMVRR